MPPGKKITFKDADRLRLEDEDRRRKRAARLAAYRDDPVGYARDELGLSLTADQEDGLNSVVLNRRTAIMASHSIGKCVAASEYIPLANGCRQKAGDLAGKTFWLNTLVDGEVRPARAHAEWNAVEPVYAIVTESGRRIVRNGHHPLWTATVTRGGGVPTVVSPIGWTPLHAIRPGHLVAVTASFPCPATLETPVSDAEIIALAYLIGDGGFTASAVVFTQQENDVFAEMQEVVSQFGCEMMPSATRPYDHRIVGRQRGDNRIIDLLREHGLMHKHSRDKRIPPAVFSFNERQLKLFLSRLFATDGWACVNRNGSAEIGFCSASEGLCLDVQELLLRFGISAHVTPKPKVNAWTLWLHRSGELIRFCERIGIFGKEEAVGRVEGAVRIKAAGRRRSKWRDETAPLGTRWEEVASVEPAGIEPTVAIEVPDHHTFLTTFWEHNTFLLAVLASWWFDCWDKHICYITAPTWDAAKEKVFAQLKILRGRMGLPGRVMDTGFIKDENKSNEPLHFVRTLNAESGEAFQGEHKAPLLILLDEAPGIPSYIWAASKGLMTGAANRLVAVGNPTDEATPFGKACEDVGNWNVLSIEALNHPNVLAELECRPPPFPENELSLLWLREMISDECEVVGERGGSSFEFWDLATLDDAIVRNIPAGSNPTASRCHYSPSGEFEGRVLGRFPTQAFTKVIPKNWLTRLPGDLAILPDWLPELGVDVAREGNDRTTIVGRRGPVVTEAIEIRRMDLDAVTGATIEVARNAARKANCDPKILPIRIDVTGGLGAGPYDFLKAQGFENAEPVNSSSRASDTEQFSNRRSELWFSSRERVRQGDLDLSRLPRSTRDLLIRELSAPSYRNNSRGQKIVDEKVVIKKAIGASPDLADGFNLAFAPSTLRKKKVFRNRMPARNLF
jgi:hypothetical protein